jgi:AcrR family transcriptional regulator
LPRPTFFNLPEEKRQKILAAAIAEFAARDYESASVSRIVIQAGIPKGSLYQYFDDKRDLHQHLLELALQKKAEMLEAAQSSGPQSTLFERLGWLFETMGRYEIEHPALAQIGYRALYGQSPLPEELVAQARTATLGYFMELIEQGKQHGEIRPEIDSRTAAFLLTAALTQLGFHLFATLPPEARQVPAQQILQSPETRRIFDQLMTMLQHGMV